MRTFTVVVLLSALLALVRSSTSEAAIRSGSVSDPSGDVDLADPAPLDLQSIGVLYDDQAGVLRVTWQYYGDVRIGAGSGGGTPYGSVALSDGDGVKDVAGWQLYPGGVIFAQLAYSSVTGVGSVSTDGRTITAEFTDALLIGRDFQRVDMRTPPAGGDDFAPFWFDGYPMSPPPFVASPVAILSSPSAAPPLKPPPKERLITFNSTRVTGIGRFKKAWRLSGALRAWGRPTSRKPLYGGKSECLVTWKRLGISARFANYGFLRGQTACAKSIGLLQIATVKNVRFGTVMGLRPGMNESGIPALYPDARQEGGSWWLASVPCTVGDCDDGQYVPVVEALVASGRVRALRMRVGAAGE